MKENLKYASYEKILFPHEDLKLIVRDAGENYIYSEERKKRLFHEELEIKLFYEGSSTISIEEDTVIVNEGDIVIINPYEIHSTIPFEGQAGKYILLLLGIDFFGNNGLGDFDLRKLLTKKGIVFNHLVSGNIRLQKILECIYKEFTTREKEYMLAIKGLLLEMFAILLREEVNEETTTMISDEKVKYYDVVEPAIREIRTHYYKKLTLDELANLCNTSKHHFCRVFKKATKMTVGQYILDYRCKMADMMLRYSDKNISEIAEACGYDDESYFCRCYKKKNGISPYKNKDNLTKK